MGCWVERLVELELGREDPRRTWAGGGAAVRREGGGANQALRTSLGEVKGSADDRAGAA